MNKIIKKIYDRFFHNNGVEVTKEPLLQAFYNFHHYVRDEKTIYDEMISIYKYESRRLEN